jgi:hypothetical protein
VDCADILLCRPWMFPISVSVKQVTELSKYTSCTLYYQLTTFYIDRSNPQLIACCCLLLRCPALCTFFNVRPGKCCQLLQLQSRGVLTAVCVAAVSRPGAHSEKCPLFGSSWIESHRADVFVVPCHAVVENV